MNGAIPCGSPIWHPFTQHALQPVMTPIARSEGAYLYTPEGSRILDAISSWWVVTHGHRHPAIVEAVKAQVDTLDQIIFAGFTHAPAEGLARELVALAPEGLSRVFYSDSGSTAVEVALKMALGYWRNMGIDRSSIVVMEGGYHGDTIGTMSVGERGVFNSAYEPLLFDVKRVPFPHAGREEETLKALSALCAEGPAAFIVEPLVLGAGGMLIYPPEVLAAMKDICEAHGVLFIADEVMTGWGRTGTLFACTQAGISPDIMCLSKGITGGLVPLAATLCREDIFTAHYSMDRSRTFFHSSSYTANPIACAAALANVGVWRNEPVAKRVATLATWQGAFIEPFRHDVRFENVRRCGTITALDLKVGDAGYLAQVAPRLMAYFLERGLLLRPLGNTIYVMPPYCVTRDELGEIYAAIDMLPGVLA
ncbi:adenosylmethionine--8-amino-7-oxononanoate transaminase [Xanthobacter variabilis]|uniref:adenosylmethionine--8-amino-7-oxononanoate transaminase n=1 Tax=Xanthobacter variabilis TaxID=3119932 RepID=UPI00374F451B